MMTKLRAAVATVTRAARAALRRALGGTRGARDTVLVGECHRATVERATGADDMPRETVPRLAPREIPTSAGPTSAGPTSAGPTSAGPVDPTRGRRPEPSTAPHRLDADRPTRPRRDHTDRP